MKTRIYFLLNLLCWTFLVLESSLALQAQESPSANDPTPDSPISVVKSKGQGETPEKAEKSALLRAVVKAVGALVDQETLVKNDELIRDQILSVSSGFVKSFKVVQEAKKNLEGDYETVLEVVVERRKLEKSLSDKGLVKVNSNAKDVWAEMLSKTASADDAMRMLEAKLPSLIERLFTVSFFEDSPKPVLLSRDSSENTAKLLWWVKISSDTKFWYTQVAPMLDACLSAIQENEKDDSSIRQRVFIRVALTQYGFGLTLRDNELKEFVISDTAFQKLNAKLGVPFLNIDINSDGVLISNHIFNLNHSVISERFPKSTGRGFIEKFNSIDENITGYNFISEKLGNLKGIFETNNFASKKSLGLIEKFIESKPQGVPLGCLFFSQSHDNHYDTGAEKFLDFKLFSNWSYEVVSGNIFLDQYHPRGSSFYLVPETVVPSMGRGSENYSQFLACLRAPRPGAVAFPLIIDIPAEDTKNTFEISAKIISSVRFLSAKSN